MKKTGLIGLLSLTVYCLVAFTSPPKTFSKAKLGEKLFHEKILSKDSSISCASCHLPAYGFSDTVAFSMGIYGRPTARNTPPVLNMKNRPYFFWDGRAASLEQQSLMPISHPDEMGLPVKEAIARLNKNKTYRDLFLKTFGTVPTAANLAAAFAAFEKTLETDSSRFDLSFDDSTLMTEQEERGRKLFVSEKTKCFDCHRRQDFTTDEFFNIGLYDGNRLNDPGRYKITGKKEDLGKFKTPGLRNVAVTAPYMHNGMFKTLEEVVEYYNNPGAFVLNPINIDKRLEVPLGLTRQEKADLVAFLKSLTDKRYEALLK
ncbi:MAG: c-type cytochrome [Chitinophagaceae bacterium]|nr:MAG: c-type cytochrome [Chitinophagaceae bacterium]